MPYIYTDEDNCPMNGEGFDRIDQDGHNPTVYMSYAEMRAAEKGEIPFDEPKHDDGCWNCTAFNGEACMRNWNNADPIYYVPERDDKDPDDYCEDWREHKGAVWEEYH